MNPSLVNLRGSIKKHVICEKCGHQYDYQLDRTAHGEFSGFAMTRAKADEKAALDAAEKLKIMLEMECHRALPEVRFADLRNAAGQSGGDASPFPRDVFRSGSGRSCLFVASLDGTMALR
jgi:hypothetical protein